MAEVPNAEIQVIPFAIFNWHNPIVAAVRVTNGIITRQMTVRTKEGYTLGTIVDIRDNKQKEMLQGVKNEVYAIKIDAIPGSVPLASKALALECFL
jgi:translation initiation factor IF-2